MFRPRVIGWLATFAAAVLAAALAPAAGQNRSFSESTQVTAIEIPVTVVRDGEPVRGLTAKDFEVYDGRRKQPIVGFDVVDLASAPAAAGGAPAAASVPVAARRHFLLLFDLTNAEPKSIVKARDAVREVALKNLTPSDLVAVATYSSAGGPRLVLNFTADRAQIEKAIDHLGLAKLVDRNLDPLRIIADDAARAADNVSPGSLNNAARVGLSRAERDAIIAEELKDVSRTAERADRQYQTALVSAFTRSFTDLARLMASVSGRKQVVFLSEGFDSSILQGVASKEEQDEMADLSAHGQYDKIDSEKRYGNTRQNNQLEKMMEAFRRADCVIQAVDIGGLRATGDAIGSRSDQVLGNVRASGEAALFQMAHDTGGELYRNFNDLGAAMGQLLHKTSVSYVLTIQPEGLKPDGAFHALRVELKNQPRGTRVTFRQGYYAPRPFKMMGGLERVLTAANGLMSGGLTPGGAGSGAGTVQTAVLAAPFRAGGAKAYVPVLIEADGNSLLGGDAPAPGSPAAGTLPAEIYAYAIDRNGAVGDFFVQTIGLDLAKVTPLLRQTGLKFFGHLELAPGDYAVRVMVRNGTTGVFGARVAPLSVPDFAAGKPVLLAPLFPEAQGKWLMVRERPRGEQRDAQYPFMAGSQPFIPASRPALFPGQEAAVSLVGWNWGPGDVKAQARILSLDGKDAAPGEIKLAGREVGNDKSPERLKGTFRPPAGLAPGDYELAVTVTGAGGSSTATMAFAVPARGAGTG
jgi:VWFA-related protein